MPFASINGVKIHYQVWGQGPVIMLLHGYTGSHQDWAFQVPLLSQAHQVVAMDHRGHGQSEAPSSAEAYSIEILAQDARGLLEHLNISKCCLIGHSMGGFVALEFTLRHPEMVTALVLVDTSSGEFERVPGYAELRAKLDELARKEGMEAAFEYNAAHNPMVRERFEKHPELREIARQRMLQTSVDGYIYTGRAISNWKPVTHRLDEIQAPTLIIVGQEDTPFLRPSQIMKDCIPLSQLVIIPEAGHSPHEEKPELFSEALLDFIGRLELGT